MKVKFNLPKQSYRSKMSFDSNTTFGFGNVQPLFSKFVLPHSKLSINFGQLTRLSPLVVPSFARLKQLNDFVFVPIASVFPAFDAFLSRNLIKGSKGSYMPNSVPVITNHWLFNLLVSKYSWYAKPKEGTKGDLEFPDTYSLVAPLYSNLFCHNNTYLSTEGLNIRSNWDFVVKGAVYNERGNAYFRLTQDGRYWYTVLKGLGYSVDPTDDKPVSVLPLLAFIKAFYDCFYVKRYNSWHSSEIYAQILQFYNGDFDEHEINGHLYDFFKGDPLTPLFGSGTFYMYASDDSSPLQVALSDPANVQFNNMGPYGKTIAFNTAKKGEGVQANGNSDVYAYQNNSMNLPSVDGDNSVLTADTLSLVDRLWHFISRSSVVGQSVKDWFKVHFGMSPTEDMFDTCILFASKSNMININSVIATSDGTNGTTSSRLGDLAGQAFSSSNDKVTFDVPTFGFVFCLSAVIPLSRVSGGTQPELYNTQYFDFPFPDFDGLGYESINQSSLGESGYKGRFTENEEGILKSGFGWLPRLSSYKFLNNFRSGGFAIPSVMDSYLSYCEDSVLDNRHATANPIPSPTNLRLNFPWRYSNSGFVSYDRIFYNQQDKDAAFGVFIPDNFMCQSSFEVSFTSYLKPLSDSYSIESLGKELLSVKAQ